MKIGVVTHWWCFENYGQLLQCYAFQQYLRQKGHSPFLIKWYPGSCFSDKMTWHKIISKLMHPSSLLLPIWNRLNGVRTRFLKRKARVAEKRDFNGFRSDHLVFTKETYRSFAEITKSKETDADLYSVGSDVVWKMIPLNDDGRIVFLDFGRPTARRISYSPSFGTAKLSEEYKAFAAPLIRRLDAVSVRELSGVQLCREMGREDAICVLDPVFLLSMEDYKSEFKVADERKGFFVYLLTMEARFDFEEVKKLAMKRPLTVTTVYNDCGFKLNELSDPTLPEWIRLVGSSECVFTNSFHCASMCIIMHTPFVVYLKKGGIGMDDRLLSILKRFNLLDRICNLQGKERKLEELLSMPIDWDNVDERLAIEKESTLEFLRNNGI